MKMLDTYGADNSLRNFILGLSEPQPLCLSRQDIAGKYMIISEGGQKIKFFRSLYTPELRSPLCKNNFSFSLSLDAIIFYIIECI